MVLPVGRLFVCLFVLCGFSHPEVPKEIFLVGAWVCVMEAKRSLRCSYY